MEKLSLRRLQSLILKKEDSYRTRALLGPIVHQMPDSYYDAAIKYLTSNQKEEIVEFNIKISEISNEFQCGYLEALCILNNIRQHPDEAYYIMHYSETE